MHKYEYNYESIATIAKAFFKFMSYGDSFCARKSKKHVLASIGEGTTGGSEQVCSGL